jgi:hypothetical protein
MPLFSNNAMVYYKSNSLSCKGGGRGVGISNCRAISRRT